MGVRPGLARLLAMLAALLVPGCGQSFDGWSKISTRHFDVYTDNSANHQDVLPALENSYAAFAASPFFRGGAARVERMEVLFMPDADFQGLFGMFRQGVALARVPGDGAIGKQGLLVLRPFALQRMDRDVRFDSDLGKVGGGQPNPGGQAAAEMVAHLFVQRVFPQAPLWLHEGLATYLNTVAIRQDAQGNAVACFGLPQAQAGYIGLPRLWDMTFAGYADASVRGFFRSTAYLFVDFVLHGENSAFREKAGGLLGGMAVGDPSVKVVETVFAPLGIAELDKRVEVHRTVLDAQRSTATAARDLCPLGALIDRDNLPEDTTKAGSVPASARELEDLFRALEALPMREEYPPYYPLDVVERVKVPPRAGG